MNDANESWTYCRNCGAPNLQSAAICGRCGTPLPGFQPTPLVPQPQPVYLPLPVNRGRPYLSWGLMAINVLVWLAMTAAGGSTNPQVLLDFGAKYGPAILDGEYWRLLTSMFLHIGLMHLAFNTYALYALGPEAERFFGRGRFAAIYLLTGVLSSATSFAISSNLAAGASGAIFGLVGALAAFYLHEHDVLGAIGRSRLSNLITVIVLNLFIGFTVANIDNAAHLGGLAAGFAIGWFLSPTYEVIPAGPAGAAQVVDRVSLAGRWWVVPAAALATAGLVLLGGLREAGTATGHYLRGRDLLAQGDWNAAVEAFSTAIDKESDYWNAYLYRGEAYLQLDDVPAASADFEAVIRNASNAQQLAIAYSGRGRIVMLSGDPRAALVDLNQAVNQAPNEPFPRFVRGLIYYQLGNAQLARSDLALALEIGLDDEQSVAVAEQVLATLNP